MKAKDLREMNVDALKNELNSLQREQFNLRFAYKINQLGNTDRMRQVRRDIARVNTILSQKLRAESAQ